MLFKEKAGFTEPGLFTPDAIRTHDLLLRRQSLYPAELREHVVFMTPVKHILIKKPSAVNYGVLLINRLRMPASV